MVEVVGSVTIGEHMVPFRKKRPSQSLQISSPLLAHSTPETGIPFVQIQIFGVSGVFVLSVVVVVVVETVVVINDVVVLTHSFAQHKAFSERNPLDPGHADVLTSGTMQLSLPVH